MWGRMISADPTGASTETPQLFFPLCVASLLIKILQRLQMELQLVVSAAQPLGLLRFPVTSKRAPPVRSHSKTARMWTGGKDRDRKLDNASPFLMGNPVG